MEEKQEGDSGRRREEERGGGRDSGRRREGEGGGGSVTRLRLDTASQMAMWELHGPARTRSWARTDARRRKDS
jgi:hypothetical protein